jgi:hypothetical protein
MAAASPPLQEERVAGDDGARRPVTGQSVLGKPRPVAAASGLSFGRSRLWNTFPHRAKHPPAAPVKNLLRPRTAAPTTAAAGSTRAGDTLVR